MTEMRHISEEQKSMEDSEENAREPMSDSS